MGTETPSSKGPRQRRAERRAALIGAAADIFMRDGYGATTLDAVVAAAGGSKSTIYTLFGGKEGLLEAVVTDLCERLLAPMGEPALRGLAPGEALRQLGCRFLEGIYEPNALALQRSAIAEAGRLPRLAAVFWTAGPERSLRAVAGYLETAQERGQLARHDARRAAARFLALLIGETQLAVLLGVRPPPDPAEIDRMVAAAVRMILPELGA